MPKKSILSFLFLCLFFAGKSQQFPSDSVLVRLFQTDRLLPVLIDSATRNSADIKRMSKSVQLFEQQLHTTRRALLNSVLLNSTYGFGTSGNIALEKDPTGLNQFTNSTIQTSRYNVGVSVQLPLGNLLSRKNTNRAAELQIEMAEDEKENTRLFVKQQVIKLYQEFKLAHRLLLTAGAMKQTSFASVNMGKKNFLDGQMSLESFSKLQNEYNQTVMDFDTQVNKFQTAFLILEAYTGVQLANLMNQVN